MEVVLDARPDDTDSSSQERRTRSVGLHLDHWDSVLLGGGCEGRVYQRESPRCDAMSYL